MRKNSADNMGKYLFSLSFFNFKIFYICHFPFFSGTHFLLLHFSCCGLLKLTLPGQLNKMTKMADDAAEWHKVTDGSV